LNNEAFTKNIVMVKDYYYERLGSQIYDQKIDELKIVQADRLYSLHVVDNVNTSLNISGD